ncbi:uncharacterized protein Z518_03634 [Rhinocladiella mackenziei CBS 650.93]|uniref:tyrosinase n=1 Tax=Rhinocladiella mackenziei CBS 650.93 TaxID=1442369 RepID=A0A0D2FU82_9EURO|nr:uncharacterized protein Z518_03634 [Rhinocladiella mackenziei CBS 650.93]KIX05662.1 hypothetical protein Z518_03634 [Rhinocladiella mackenziei CBS 650.93]
MADNVVWSDLRELLKRGEVKTAPFGVQKRYEITDMATEARIIKRVGEFNLYLLALEKLQLPTDPASPLRKDKAFHQDFSSYFHLAGLHGFPQVEYQGVGFLQMKDWAKKTAKGKADLSGIWPSTPRDSKTSGGYCVHGSPLFLIWHRPYLALMEQTLLSAAKEIVDSWSADSELNERLQAQKNEDTKALKALRLPYWDFCRPWRKGEGVGAGDFDYGLPPPLSLPYIKVRRPNKLEYEYIQNPLYQYVFPETQINTTKKESKRYKRVLEFAKLGPVAGSKPIRTTRNAGVTGKTSHKELTDQGNRFLSTMRDRLYRTFTLPDKEFQQVSTARTVHLDDDNPFVEAKPENEKDSFESIHDNYHVILGGMNPDGQPHGKGAMTLPHISAFDPAFWLLHGFYEWTLCLWQIIHPQKYWDPDFQIKRSNKTEVIKWMKPLGKESAETPLLPFMTPRTNPCVANKIEDRYWNTLKSRYWEQFGYSYDNLPGVSKDDDNLKREKDAKSANALVNALYGWVPGPTLTELETKTRKEFLTIPQFSAMDWFPKKKSDGTPVAFPFDDLTLDDLSDATGPGLFGIMADAGVPSDKKPKKPEAIHFDPRRVFPAHLQRAGKMRHWSFNFNVEKFALKGTFVVYVFIGDFTPNQDNWFQDPSLVDASAIWARDVDENMADECPNCQQQLEEDSIYGDTVPLTSRLVDMVEARETQPPTPEEGMVLRSLDPEDVIPFLRRNLHWRVVDRNGAQVPREKVGRFLTYVTSRTMAFPKTIYDLPVWDNPEVYREVTHGRPSGLCFAPGS